MKTISPFKPGPKNPDQATKHAIDLFTSGKFLEAEQIFLQQHETSPTFVTTLFLAQIAQLRQEGAEWIQQLEEGLNQYRESYEGYYVLGHSYQQNGQLPEATKAFYLALNWKLQHQLTKPESAPSLISKPLAPQLSSEAMPILFETLADLKQAGFNCFPTAGTLLGLERSGQLLPNDKDIDIGIDWTQMNTAIKHLIANNWKEERNSYGLTNPRCLRHSSGLILDLCGYATEQTTGATISGLWMTGVPFDWNRITQFPAIQLRKRASIAGEIWYPSQPEQLLAALYGDDWQTPDAHFDTIVCAPNLLKDSWLYYCQAYARLYNSWQKEEYSRMKSMLQTLSRFRPKDILLNQLTNFVQLKLNLNSSKKNDNSEQKRRVLALGYFDLLHPGHLNYLDFAKAQGDYLIVGVAPDRFALKSKGRATLLDQQERLSLVQGLRWVDQAVLVGAPMAETENATRWIAQQQIDIVVCGAEWQNTPRWNELEKALNPLSIKVLYAPRTAGISSTQIKKRLQTT